MFLSKLVVVTTISSLLDAGGPGRIHALIFWESQLAVPERGPEGRRSYADGCGNRRELPPERAETPAVRYSPLMYRRARICWVNGLPCRVRACFAGRQQTDNSSQRVPGRLVQGRISPDEVADHLPGRNVECALGCWPHRQRD